MFFSICFSRLFETLNDNCLSLNMNLNLSNTKLEELGGKLVEEKKKVDYLSNLLQVEKRYFCFKSIGILN